MIAPGHSTFTRDEWAGLRLGVPMPIVAADLEALRATGEPLSLTEVEQVYLPLARLLSLHIEASRRIARVTSEFLGRPDAKRPFVVAIAGSVAVGKSSVARLLRTILARWPEPRRIDLVATDGFIYPTSHLQSAGLMRRKGFPESYDIRRMIAFLAGVRATGQGSLPVYSHQAYDIVPGQLQTVEQPDVLLFEGLNVLGLQREGEGGAMPHFIASDFFDFSIYVDADERHIEQWYVERFLLLKQRAFANPLSYFHHLADAPDDETRHFAHRLWQDINLPNLQTNILPTRERADLIIHKAADHAADGFRLRGR